MPTQAHIATAFHDDGQVLCAARPLVAAHAVVDAARGFYQLEAFAASVSAASVVCPPALSAPVALARLRLALGVLHPVLVLRPPRRPEAFVDAAYGRVAASRVAAAHVAAVGFGFGPGLAVAAAAVVAADSVAGAAVAYRLWRSVEAKAGLAVPR